MGHIETSTSSSSNSNNSKLLNSPLLPVLSYCVSSILMTVTNKYVFSGYEFNLNFFLLLLQSIICVCAITAFKTLGIIGFRDFSTAEARKWFPISALLVVMIWTSSKALQYLSIPVYTIFKNLTIILIAYGEVLWFGGAVTSLALFSFGLMVLSSVVAAWADIRLAIEGYTAAAATAGEYGAARRQLLGAPLIREFENDKELLGWTAAAQSKVLIHFYKADFDRCKVMNAHLEGVARLHAASAPRLVVFTRAKVENVPFTVVRLGIQVLPCVLCFDHGAVVDRLIGFEGISNKRGDDIDDALLQRWFIKNGLIQRVKDASLLHGRNISQQQQEKEEDDEWD